MCLSTVMSHLSFVFKRKTDPKLPKNILPPKCFSKKQCRKCYFFLFLRKTWVDMYPQKPQNKCIKDKQSYIHSSSCGKYDSNDIFRFAAFGRITIICWVIRNQKKTVQNITPLQTRIRNASSNYPFSGDIRKFSGEGRLHVFWFHHWILPN